MTSRTENAKRYKIRFKEGASTEVVADTVNAPNGTGTSEENKFYLFELNGDVVAKFKYAEVSGWQRISSTGRPSK